STHLLALPTARSRICLQLVSTVRCAFSNGVSAPHKMGRRATRGTTATRNVVEIGARTSSADDAELAPAIATAATLALTDGNVTPDHRPRPAEPSSRRRTTNAI